MNAPIRSFVIIGGGTAGWMAAAYLNRAFGDSGRNDVTVTLVESEDIGIIGVGEATLPTLRLTMDMLGIPEWKLINDTDGTFKHGTKFANWSYDPAKHPGDFYFHTFESPVVTMGHNMMTHWQIMRETGATSAKFHDLAGVQTALCDRNLSPKMFNSAPYAAPLPYGYHLDAVKLGHMLRDISLLRSVRRLVDTIVEVKLSEDGTISGVVGEKNGLIEGDFFIDCSGFSAVLIEKALGETFVDMSDSLPCDRAVACQVPHLPGNTVRRPYTTSTAKSAGWMWDIDLYTRRGAGYVYSSRFISDDDAEAELRAHLGPISSGLPAKRLQMRVGRRLRPWVGNCLALGLSSSFIEPLESTGIYLIEMGLTLFLDYMDGNRGVNVLRDKYNSLMNSLYLELVDFITLHYITTLREDTEFWRTCQHEMRPSASLNEKLEIWKYKVPGTADLSERITAFGPSSYFYVLAGMRNLPVNGIAVRPYISPEMSREARASIEASRAGAIKAAPDHYEFVKKMRSTAL